MNTGKREKILKEASEDLCKTLNAFGSRETLRLLLEFSRYAPIVNELLTKYPFIVAIEHFLLGKLTVQVDEKTFQTLVDANPEIWIGTENNNPEEERNACGETRRRPKRTRNRKRNLASTKRHQSSMEEQKTSVRG